MTGAVVARQPAGLRALWLFVAGFISVLTFHQFAGWALLATGILPPGAFHPWPLTPVPPFGVPSLISMGFWGGLWAVLIGFVCVGRAHGPAYWLGWLLACGILPTLGFLYLVPFIKGLPIAAPAEVPVRFAIGFVINGSWGLGNAILLALTGLRASLWRR
jgi:hypothetical protein